MLSKNKKYLALKKVISRECKRLVSRPLYILCMVIIPLFCYVFFVSMLYEGLPTKLPAGLVDQDQTSVTRRLARTLTALEQTDIVAHYPTVGEARHAMQKGEIYGFYYIPEGTTRKASTFEQPEVSFYTNNTILVAGSLLFRDMKVMSELASAGVKQKIMRAKGKTEDQILEYVRPIIVENHPLNNPWLNYSVYLSNVFIPGTLSLMILLVTVFSISVEIKEKTSQEWLKEGNDSIWISLSGKLIPQTIIFFIMGLVYLFVLYGIMKFPCNNGIMPMVLAMLCLVLGSQGFGVFMIGMLPAPRLGLSFASLWGILSFSMCGLSFPQIAMDAPLQALNKLFPLRHYLLIYVDQALNGYPMYYSWVNYVGLLLFMMLPFFVAGHLRKALKNYKYMP